MISNRRASSLRSHNDGELKKWSVSFQDGRHIGYVHETNEELARCAALSRYSDVIGDKDFSVLER